MNERIFVSISLHELVLSPLHGENVAGSIPMWKIFDGLNMMRDIKVFVSARKFDNF